MTRSALTIAFALAALTSSAHAGGQTKAKQAPRKKVHAGVDHVSRDGAVLRRTVVLEEGEPSKVSRVPQLTWRNFNAGAKGFEIEDGGPAEMADRPGQLSLDGKLELHSSRTVGKRTYVKLRHPTRGGEPAHAVRVLHKGRRIITRRKVRSTEESAPAEDAQDTSWNDDPDAAWDDERSIQASRPTRQPPGTGRPFDQYIGSTAGDLHVTASPHEPGVLQIDGAGFSFDIDVDALAAAASNPGHWVTQSNPSKGTQGLSLGFDTKSGALAFRAYGVNAHVWAQSYEIFADTYNRWIGEL